MTYGEIRYRLSQLVPGIGMELWDGWILDRYQEILDSLSWQRLERKSTVVPAAEYAVGTVAVTQGSTAIAGTGTTWTTQMSGRVIRIAGRTELYTFTYSSGTTGTLDRSYEGPAETEAAYRINDNRALLAADSRLIVSLRSPTGGPLGKLSRVDLDRLAPGRTEYGAPRYYCFDFDDTSDPPRARIELYPIPTAAEGLILTEVADADSVTAGDTAASLLPWVRPACLVAGCRADGLDHLEKYKAADRAQLRFQSLLVQMRGIAAERQGPVALKLSDDLYSHRTAWWAGEADQ